MGRPPLAVGVAGAIQTTQDPETGYYRARAYVRDPDGRRREISRFRATKASAERAVTAALKDRQYAASVGDVNGDTRLAVVLEQYLADLDASARATQTKNLYRGTVDRHVKPALGELRLRELTVPRLDAALRAIRSSSGPGTARTARAVLSNTLSVAVRLGAIPTNPIRDVKISGDGDGKDVRALTAAEEDRVRDAPRSMRRAVDLDLPDVIDWMLGTGMRIGEVCAIRQRGLDGRRLLDLKTRTVEINATVIRVTGKQSVQLGIPRGVYVQERTKSDAGWRVLALPDDLVDMLQRRAGELRVDGPDLIRVIDDRGRVHMQRDPGVVFFSPRGALRDPSNTQTVLREILAAIDRVDGDEPGPFAWVTSHVFRKTVATRLDDEGMSARQIADVLGHKRPSMTQDVYMGRKVVSADAARILARRAPESAA